MAVDSVQRERDEQRRYKRFACNTRTRALAGRLLVPGTLIDLSQGGYLFRPQLTTGLLQGTTVNAELCGHRLTGELVSCTPKGLHCRFPRLLTGKEVAEILLLLAAAGAVKINGVGREEAKRLMAGLPR